MQNVYKELMERNNKLRIKVNRINFIDNRDDQIDSLIMSMEDMTDLLDEILKKMDKL